MSARLMTCALALAACACAQARAQDPAQGEGGAGFHKIDAVQASGFWLDSGFATEHFNRRRNLNGGNRGVAFEYRVSTTAALSAGGFVNSDRAWSDYAGVIWQPYAFGPIRLGAALAAFNGYPRMRGGGWFPAAIPTATYEYQRVGVNVGIVPSYKGRLYGGISVQLKVRLF
ncbi:hypothetical protein [Massilia sp. 9096]|uniref:hypothetical protein n=1 Tax=Massilia sp. 9096 TaxID=1500894 RepID=UPI001EFAD38A|nr:hypothetical protein [Massilia sp. 9096]